MIFLLMKKSALLIVVTLLISASGSMAEPFQLQHLLVEADQKSPSLRAAREQIAVAESKIAQVSSLSDPQLSLSLLNYPINNLKSSQIPMTGNEVRLSQLFPFPGKLAAKGEIATQKSRWFAAAYQDARLQVRQRVKDAWYRLLYQRKAIDLTNRNLKILDDFIRLTETRYEVGKGLQQNVLKAQLQRSKQLDKLLSLEQQQEATLAELNSLVGRDTDQPLETQEKLEESANVYDLHELRRQAEQNRPMFAAFTALTDQYKAQRGLAKLDYRPDFKLWAGYRWRDDALPDGGTDFVSTGISFNLPVRRARRAAAVAEADSSLRMAYRQRDNFHDQVWLDIHSALTRFERATRLAELYKNGIIPQADQTFQATLSAYQVDKVDFLDLLDALMTLYRYEIDYFRALSDQHRSQASLEAAAGLAVDQLKSPEIKNEG